MNSAIFDWNFEYIKTNGVELNTLVEGEGPLVILLHGFPQCSFLWRHQIQPIIDAGYRVAVPDQRGYGPSDAPAEITEYTIRKLAGDVAGIARALGYSEFIVLGQDWGAPVAWHTALLHEDTCRAVMGMSVPYTRMDDWNGWIENPSTENGFWYMRYFQRVGIPEREIEKNLKEGLHRFYSTLCAESSGAWINQVNHPKEASILDIMAPANQKLSWLSEGELNYYVNFFKEEGLRGPINWYRAIPLNGSDTMELSAKKISQPAAFISGAKDDVLKYGGLNNEWFDAMDAWFLDLKFKTLIEDAGHWLQCEKPKETTREILKFLEMVY